MRYLRRLNLSISNTASTDGQLFDIVLAGGGLSGLALATELARRPAFSQQRILILDREAKTQNDRTWSFWATPNEWLPPVVHREWQSGYFYAANLAQPLDMGDFRYCMVRGLDFYQWAKAQLAKAPNVTLLQANIDRIDSDTGTVYTDRGIFRGEQVFNSAFLRQTVLPAPSAVYPNTPFSAAKSVAESAAGYVYLLQHFKGWVVRTEQPVFKPEEMTLMDFRVPQGGETRFVYVMPFDERCALVEYTAFSPQLYTDAHYQTALQHYMQQLVGTARYTVEDTEFGVIPMTNYPFWPLQAGKVWHIGTAGGFVKPSSGYAFKRTWRRVRAFVDVWERTGRVPAASIFRSALKYRWYDSVLLNVLATRGDLGATVFSRMFGKIPAQLIFRFLDEDTTLHEDIQIMRCQMSAPFLKAAAQCMPYVWGRL